MNQVDKKIMETGVVPVIKLENPERDARPLAEALCAGGGSCGGGDFPGRWG